MNTLIEKIDNIHLNMNAIKENQKPLYAELNTANRNIEKLKKDMNHSLDNLENNSRLTQYNTERIRIEAEYLSKPADKAVYT